jgi:excisionase family DNA binding protein
MNHVAGRNDGADHPRGHHASHSALPGSGRMSVPQLPGKPGRANPPVVDAQVPQQAGSPETSSPSERLAYSVDEAAHLTGLSRDLLYDEMRRGNLVYLKIGRRRLITRQHLEQFLGITPSTPDAPAPLRTADQ